MIKKETIPGLIFSFVFGIIIYFLAPYVGGLNSVMLALLLGIIAGNAIMLPPNLSIGISFSSSKLLEISILFMAFGISFSHIAELGWQNFLLIALTILAVLIITVFLARRFNCPDSTGWLVGFGTAICGSSAIAAVAPGISQSKEAPGIALAVVNLLGSIGMLVLPLVFVFFNINETDSGILLGASLHSVGNVAGAGYGISDAVGETAITVKLARVALLSPAVIIFTLLVNTGNKKKWTDYLQLPYYLWLFIIISILVSFIDLPSAFLSLMNTLGKISLTIAMVAIGLKVSFRQLYQSGRRALGFGVVIFTVQLTVAALLLYILS
jgi:uncharacterized integral membrane protein (TIGR00698 family)